MKHVKFALVTGASRGLGRATAIHLARTGYQVILTARDAIELDATLAAMPEGAHSAVAADLSLPADLDRLVAAVTTEVSDSGLSCFVHCAAAEADPDVEGALENTTHDVASAHLTVTAASGVHLLGALKPLLSKAGKAQAIFISSDWVIEGSGGPPVFAASKAFATHVWRLAQAEFLEVGCVLCALVCGDIATYDLDWSEPKWGIDDSVDDIKAELGLTRIAMADILRAIDFVVACELGAVTQISLRPLDPDYTP